MIRENRKPLSAQILPGAALLRSPAFHFTALVALLALAGSIASSTGCGASDRNDFLEAREPPNAPSPSAGDETAFGGTDASARSTASVRGSPLCGVTDNDKCMPDDDGTKAPSAGPCVELLPEAGAAPDGDTSITTACRATKTKDAYGSGCYEADRRGTEGVACERGEDCAPGFECIEGETGGVCKRYCCLGPGSCATHTSQNGGPTFCDIQKVVAQTPRDAPVCMPIKKCKLLVPGECSANETCAIVTEKGDSGCVSTGNAKAGEPCDEKHCGVDLTCIGNPGDRRCYRLCRVNGTDCGPTQACMTGAVFQDTTFGVCKQIP